MSAAAILWDAVIDLSCALIWNAAAFVSMSVVRSEKGMLEIWRTI